MEIAVVGAGPAGAWTAYCLARSGARVTMFDPSHPREKPCGGGVTGRALSLVGDAMDVESVPATIVRAARFLDARRDDGALVPLDETTYDDGRPALLVASRAAFDRALVAAAVRAGAQHCPARVL